MEEEEVEQPENELEDDNSEEEGEEETSEEEGDGEPVSQTDGDVAVAEDDEDVPEQVFLPTGEGPATARLREMLDPELNAAVQAAISEQVNRAMQSFGVSQAAYAQAAGEHPEVFSKYGSKINMTLAMFPEAERHTRKSVDIATILAATEHKAGTPEFARHLLRIAQQLNGGTPAPKAPKAPIPALSRPPTPSSGVRSQPVTSRDGKIKSIMETYGLDRDEAEGMLAEVSKPGRRR